MTAYTPAQQAAIACIDAPLQIIACAGSGKTQVISQRIANLISSGRAEPRNIVAFTFTEKAAAELRDRVFSLVAQDGNVPIGLAEMYIGTMHAYCLDVLQQYVPETFKFGVLTEITSRMLVDRNSKKSGLTTCPTSSAGTPKLRRFIHSKLYLQVMSMVREDNIDWDLLPSGVVESFLDYLGVLRETAYFDYTSMILLVVELLEAEADDSQASALRHHVSEALTFVVVDEYQDVNPLQERLIDGLTQFGANLCVVGDDDQTIYQWRGSEVRNIIDFADRHDGVEQVTLDDNFRSSEAVVALGRSIADLIPDGKRLAKNMVAAGHQEWSQNDLLALAFEDEEAEVAWICERIQVMIGVIFVDAPGRSPRGLSYSDFAVLFRSVAGDAGPLVEEMRRRGIPFVIKGLSRLFEAPEIQAVVKVFDYMVDSCDAESLRVAWNDAQLIPDGGDWSAALTVLDTGRAFDRGERWGIYNIQRLYLDFLEALSVREDTLPGVPSRRELVFYQLGKFSQAISDFEQIHFSSEPRRKYESFANWLQHQAPSYYADSDGDVGYATPDAVVISTVHQAKGMQWPAVFVPYLRRNRFPSRRSGGLGVFHVIPEIAVADPARYRGTLEDETRLFYVAVTRAQKFVFMTFSPGIGRHNSHASQFFEHCVGQMWVGTRDEAPDAAASRLAPTPKVDAPEMTLTFSELKYYFECPYQFKMRFLYGFNPPIHEAIGYGKGLHDALAEIHKRALAGDFVDESMAGELVFRHLHTPYAYPRLRQDLARAAEASVRRYLRDRGAELSRTIHSEKSIQVHLGEGLTVEGRIDLIRSVDSGEVSIVDFKSTERAQEDDVTRDQLHIYALGYEELSGKRADLIEVLNLDNRGGSLVERVEAPLIDSVRRRVVNAADALRSNSLEPHEQWCAPCEKCDFSAMCPTKRGGPGVGLADPLRPPSRKGVVIGSTPEAPTLALQIGDCLRHRNFGRGRVQQVIGTGPEAVAVIDFGNTTGRQQLVIGSAPFTKIDEEDGGD